MTAMVLHLEHPDRPGLAACCGLPLGTIDPPARYTTITCAGCAAELDRPADGEAAA